MAMTGYGERNLWQGWKQPQQGGFDDIATWAHGYDSGESKDFDAHYPFKGDCFRAKDRVSDALLNQDHLWIDDRHIDEDSGRYEQQSEARCIPYLAPST